MATFECRRCKTRVNTITKAIFELAFPRCKVNSWSNGSASSHAWSKISNDN